jgi:ATP-binding cassette subfamily B protein
LKNFDIVCEHIDFSYNQDGEQAIHDLSLVIPAGGITALVGPSGSGKSTLSRLIARFWDVDSGRITIGGVDVKTLDPEHLVGYMSFVFQDVLLFNDTILGNIRIGNMNAGEEQVLAAAKAACCDEFAARLPDGYKTMLGENGATLSGGERQRISIARAILKDAPIVLLDEATASLDPENEDQIQKAISELVKGRTVIVIAHRLRTVIGADKIAVLERGRLVEEGTGTELLAKKGLFARLYTLQQESLHRTYTGGWRLLAAPTALNRENGMPTGA